MGYIDGDDREQRMMFPSSLDEYVTENNPVRFLDAFVMQLDMENLGFQRSRPNVMGRPSYDPRDLLKLFIYGYLYNIKSSRKLERETHRNVELMWLVNGLKPDFKTIADFRKDNKKGIAGTFRQFTLLSKEAGLFGCELVAIDGSKFKGVNSNFRNMTRSRLRYLLNQVNKKIDNYLNLLNKEDQKENQVHDVSKDELKEKIEALKKKQNN